MRTKKSRAQQPEIERSSPASGERKTKSKSHNSIEHKHFEKLSQFQNKDKTILAKKKQIQACEDDIEKTIKRRDIEVVTRNNLSAVFDIECQIYNKRLRLEELRKEMERLQSGQDEIDYLLNSYKILQDYANLEQEEQKVLLEIEKKQLGAKGEDSYTLESCLGLKAPQLPIKERQENENTLEDRYLELSQKKTALVDNYNSILNVDVKEIQRKKEQPDVCKKCSVNFLFDKGFLICPECGYCLQCIEAGPSMSYKELCDYDMKPQFSYMKITHFDDWLKRFQAKENTSIPQEVLDKVIIELKKERITDLTKLSEEKCKKILKKLGYNKYYDHVVHIIHRLNGIPPLQLTSKVEEKLRKMFLQIQEPFEKHKPKNRKNFLSYSYCLHKMFQILNLPEYTRYFTLLKSPDKLRQQDEIFKKIVQEMSETDESVNWVFYPSI